MSSGNKRYGNKVIIIAIVIIIVTINIIVCYYYYYYYCRYYYCYYYYYFKIVNLERMLILCCMSRFDIKLIRCKLKKPTEASSSQSSFPLYFV